MKLTYGIKENKVTLDLKKLLGKIYYGHEHKVELDFTAIKKGIWVKDLKVTSVKCKKLRDFCQGQL